MKTFSMSFLRTFLVLLLASESTPAFSQTLITGRATIVDGDTLNMDGLRVRLFGVDAPEIAQTCTLQTGAVWACGAKARQALSEKLGNRIVACEQRDIDSYRRIVAVCRIDDVDIGEWLVASGWAIAYREFSSDYIAPETTAISARQNIWSGEFQTPDEFRRSQDSSSKNDESNRKNCRIKGNISTSGERIYHVPSGEFYERTVISPTQGERLFCTEEEAREAGWRRSLR